MKGTSLARPAHGSHNRGVKQGTHPGDERVVWFALRGDGLDPADITARTGLTPTKAWRVGDGRPHGGTAHSDNVWLLDSGRPRSDEFHDCLNALLALLRPSWPELVALGQEFAAEVGAAIYCYEAQGPLVQVSPEASAALAELNATLGFDLYALPTMED
jgi:hypothetical protein